MCMSYIRGSRWPLDTVSFFFCFVQLASHELILSFMIKIVSTFKNKDYFMKIKEINIKTQVQV